MRLLILAMKSFRHENHKIFCTSSVAATEIDEVDVRHYPARDMSSRRNHSFYFKDAVCLQIENGLNANHYTVLRIQKPIHKLLPAKSFTINLLVLHIICETIETLSALVIILVCQHKC